MKTSPCNGVGRSDGRCARRHTGAEGGQTPCTSPGESDAAPAPANAP